MTLPGALETKLLVGAFALAVGAGGIVLAAAHERKLGAAKEHEARVEEQAAASAVVTAVRAGQAAQLEGVSHDAQLQIARSDAFRLAADRALQQLLVRAREARRGASSPSPAGSAPASDADVVQSELFRRVAEAAGQYSSLADKRGDAGTACERAAATVGMGL